MALIFDFRVYVYIFKNKFIKNVFLKLLHSLVYTLFKIINLINIRYNKLNFYCFKKLFLVQ